MNKKYLYIIIAIFTGILFYINTKNNDINIDYQNNIDSNIGENAYEIPIYNSFDDVFEFTYKKVFKLDIQNYTYKLIYIEENTGKEREITERYGAYTYGNDKIYVCCTDNNITYTIYEIDLTNNMEEKEIIDSNCNIEYIVEDKLVYGKMIEIAENMPEVYYYEMAKI